MKKKNNNKESLSIFLDVMYIFMYSLISMYSMSPRIIVKFHGMGITPFSKDCSKGQNKETQEMKTRKHRSEIN